MSDCVCILSASCLSLVVCSGRRWLSFSVSVSLLGHSLSPGVLVSSHRLFPYFLIRWLSFLVSVSLLGHSLSPGFLVSSHRLFPYFIIRLVLVFWCRLIVGGVSVGAR